MLRTSSTNAPWSHRGAQISYDGHEIDLTPPWQRLTVWDAMERWAGVKYGELTDDGDAKKVADSGLAMDRPPTKANVINKLLDERVEPNLIQPTFLLDYPVEISPIAKRIPDRPDHLQVWAFVAGKEIGNAFSELNDPIDQRERFLQQVQAKAMGDDEAHVFDEDFIVALEYECPLQEGWE